MAEKKKEERPLSKEVQERLEKIQQVKRERYEPKIGEKGVKINK